MNTDSRPHIRPRDIPAIIACYAAVWLPIVALIFFPESTAMAIHALLEIGK